MTLTPEQIEWIVAEVIRRLTATGEAVDSPSKTDFKVAERVVTLRTIEKQLSGVKRVVVQRRAVVTPAVKDELRAKKIELVYQQ
jgi:hypothetical protein